MAASASAVKTLLKEFYEENPGGDAKAARITDSERTWQEQLAWILKRPDSYPNIVKRFLTKFKLKKLPALKELESTEDQYDWWEDAILAQAGKPGGFMHVVPKGGGGSKAVDVGVAKLKLDLKLKLYDKLTGKFKVLREKASQYKNVQTKDATCFHCY
jgi:hypothetical protein